jgi:hypothetical protein
MAQDHSNDGFFTTSNPIFDKVTITQTGDNGGSTRALTGNAVGGFYADGSSYQVTFATLSATATLKGVPAVPQPQFHFYSSNPNVIAIGLTSGIATRKTDTTSLSFNSNGAANLVQGVSSNIGGLATIRAVPLRADGSECSPEGLFYLVCQDAASRQWGTAPHNMPSNAQPSYGGTASPNYYSLVGDTQPPKDNS